MKRIRALIASTALAIVATSVVVAPPATAAADCSATQTPTLAVQTVPNVFVTGAGTVAPQVNLVTDVSISCGEIVSGFGIGQNTSTQTRFVVPLAKYTDNGIVAGLSGNSALTPATQYGRFILGTITVNYKRKAADPNTPATLLSTSLTVNTLFFSRSIPYVGKPYPDTQSVNEGNSVGLSGYLSTVLDKPEKISLQIQNGANWDIVDTVDVDGENFTFIYTPTKSVVYRYYYSQSDWADAKGGLPAVINFVPKEVIKKVPSAPPAFVSDTTETTISLDWSPPADPNGTISAYRFGWDTPQGKPVPSFEDTYPTSGTVPDPFVFTKLAPGANYTVWVEAVNENGRSARTSIATETDESPIIQPPPPPPPPRTASVTVGTRSKGGKLHVDVNPNRGKAYWTFVVQKFTGGKWVNGKAYRTKGASETRTINLKRGLYRVVVQSKFGYRGTVSSAVFLKK